MLSLLFLPLILVAYLLGTIMLYTLSPVSIHNPGRLPARNHYTVYSLSILFLPLILVVCLLGTIIL